MKVKKLVAMVLFVVVCLVAVQAAFAIGGEAHVLNCAHPHGYAETLICTIYGFIT